MKYLAENISSFFLFHSLIEEKDFETYTYCFEVILSGIFFFASILSFSYILGLFWATVFYLLSFSLIRKYAGGFHAATHGQCFIISFVTYIVYIICLYTISPEYYFHLSYVFVILATYLLLTLCPNIAYHKNSFHPEKLEKMKAKLKNYIIVFLFVVILLSISGNSAILFYLSYGYLQAAISASITHFL